MEGGTTSQFPLLDADGTPNEPADLNVAANRFIGSGTGFYLDAPGIGSVSMIPPRALRNTVTGKYVILGLRCASSDLPLASLADVMWGDTS